MASRHIPTSALLATLAIASTASAQDYHHELLVEPDFERSTVYMNYGSMGLPLDQISSEQLCDPCEDLHVIIEVAPTDVEEFERDMFLLFDTLNQSWSVQTAPSLVVSIRDDSDTELTTIILDEATALDIDVQVAISE